MRYAGLLLVLFWKLVLLPAPSKAQNLKDTIRLQPIQIDGRRWTGNYNETRSEIDSSTLAKSITVRLSELLSQNTPIFIKEYGRGAMATASFRGTAPSHTRVTWNGLELNSPMLGMVDFSLIPVYFTDYVKLLHGSSSLGESSGALGGTIQLENQPDWGKRHSGKLLSGIGSYRTFDEFLQLNYGNRKILSKSAIFYNSSANDFSYTNKLNASIDPVTGNYIYSREKNENADYRNYGFLEEIYLQPDKNQTISLKTWLQHNDRSIPQLLTNESEGAANINRQSENALRSVAEWKHFGTSSKLSVLSAVNLQNSSYSLENRVSGAPDQLVIDSDARVLSFINRLSFRNRINDLFTLETGLDANLYRADTENRMISGQSAGYDKSRFENSLSGKLEARMNPHLTAFLLIRENIIDFEHEALLPLLSMSYRPIKDNPLVFKGSVAYNSHPPTLNDLYYLPGGNPDLKSEKGTQVDLNASDDFSLGKAVLHTAISLFNSKINNWIIWLPTFQGYWEPFNLEKVSSTGAEANASLIGDLRIVRYAIKANYAFTSTVNQAGSSPAYGKQLPYIPLHSANLDLHLEYSGFYFDWMWNYYSKRYTTSANSRETVTDYLYPYFMNNLQFGMLIPVATNRIKAEIKIMNLFDEQYRTVLQRPMPGRNYQFILSYDF